MKPDFKNPLWDPITYQVQSREFLDGRNARFEMKTLDDCPYTFGDEPLNVRWHDWICGWTAADDLKKYIAECFKNHECSPPYYGPYGG